MINTPLKEQESNFVNIKGDVKLESNASLQVYAYAINGTYDGSFHSDNEAKITEPVHTLMPNVIIPAHYEQITKKEQ